MSHENLKVRVTSLMSHPHQQLLKNEFWFIAISEFVFQKLFKYFSTQMTNMDMQLYQISLESKINYFSFHYLSGFIYQRSPEVANWVKDPFIAQIVHEFWYIIVSFQYMIE